MTWQLLSRQLWSWSDYDVYSCCYSWAAFAQWLTNWRTLALCRVTLYRKSRRDPSLVNQPISSRSLVAILPQWGQHKSRARMYPNYILRYPTVYGEIPKHVTLSSCTMMLLPLAWETGRQPVSSHDDYGTFSVSYKSRQLSWVSKSSVA